MRVIQAQHAGFCKGVERAIAIAQALATGKGPIYTDGPLIHNKPVLKELAQQGIQQLPESLQNPQKATVVIRAHGIAPERRTFLQNLGVELHDATCPDVGVIAGKIRRQVKHGYTVIIFGDPTHPEVIGLLGYTEGHGTVVQDLATVSTLTLPDHRPICCVSQSTQAPDDYAAVVEALRARWPQLEAFDTICMATKLRQGEILELKNAGAQALVVVGSPSSANTKKLVVVAQKLGLVTFPIEGVQSLSEEWFDSIKSFECVAVTGGASAPLQAIEAVCTALRAYQPPSA